jgi:hypothetical protein
VTEAKRWLVVHSVAEADENEHDNVKLQSRVSSRTILGHSWSVLREPGVPIDGSSGAALLMSLDTTAKNGRQIGHPLGWE